MKFLEPYWEKLDPRHRRWVVVGLIVVGALAFFTVLALLVPEPRKIGERKLVLKHLLTDSDPRSLGIEGLATQLRQVTQKSDEVLRRIETLEDQQKQNRDTQEERFRKLGSLGDDDTKAEINALKSQIETLSKGGSGTSRTGSDDILPAVKGQSDRTPASTQIDNLFDRSSGSKSAVAAKPITEIRTIRVGHDSEKDKATPGATPPSSGSDNKGADEGESVFIPAGTILSGNLLNGLDAPTGKKARKEPFPVLARIKHEGILPNRFRADLRECFLVAAGYGDLSAERAYIRSETLSCVRQDGGVIEVPIDAYAVGEDGKVGLRGAVVSKQGQLMATSLLAGFAKGISDAFGKVQIPVFMTGGNGSLSNNVPYQNAFSTQAMEGSSLRGVGYSMDRMAHYYMDLAENLFPVVEIDATRQIEFVIQRGTELKLNHPKDTHRPVRTSNRPY